VGRLPGVRIKIARKLAEDFGVPMAEMARQLGIATAGMSKILSRSGSN